jgi:hypothetical protein
MEKINRTTFLKKSIHIGALAFLLPVGVGFSAAPKTHDQEKATAGDLFKRLVRANEKEIERILNTGNGLSRVYSRNIGYDFAKLAAGYCCSSSAYYENPKVLARLEAIAAFLLHNQRPDGTMNVGNLESPPDTGFVMEPVCSGTALLLAKKSKVLQPIRNEIRKFILSAAEALTYGGVHTPNHRWVVCDALARVNALYPNPKYVNRIDEWLGEGIYMDEDGHYPERSMNYSDVENSAFICLGRLLKRPELFEAPRKSLDMTYYYMEPNTDLVTTDSRRQDQYSFRSIVGQYLHYRYLAIQDKNGKFAAIARLIENAPGFEEAIVKKGLFYFMENPLLQQELPPESTLPVDFEKFFSTSSLARIRRGTTTATIFGGVDWPLVIASGRSVSPNFFSYRKGQAILSYMRLSSQFFNMGHFRSEGLRRENGKYILFKKLEAPYYQPLPAALRNKEGDYLLTHSIDDRFWSKMAFDQRPVSNVKSLETTITIEEKNGRVDLTFDVRGMEAVAVTIELCFRKGGELTGVTPVGDSPDNHYFEGGAGRYKIGEDSITFGPGRMEHDRIRDLDGEKYSVHFGSLRTEGEHVYITGLTPFSHTLTLQ